MQIKQIETIDLIPYARNARTHSESQIKQVLDSIKEFGFINPVITDGQNGIIAGHCRVLAALKMGLDTVPCLEASHLTEKQKRAYILADNKLAENAGWDEEALQSELKVLMEMDFDIEKAGFTAKDLLEAEQEFPVVLDETKYLLMLEFDNEKELQSAYEEAMNRGIACKIIE